MLLEYFTFISSYFIYTELIVIEIADIPKEWIWWMFIKKLYVIGTDSIFLKLV